MLQSFVDINAFPIYNVIRLLLADKTTKKSIVLATEEYLKYGPQFAFDAYMTPKLLLELVAHESKPKRGRPPKIKSDSSQHPPALVCNKENNCFDNKWFGKENVFNQEGEDGTAWETTNEPVVFSRKRSWKKYVDCKRYVGACGEGEYVVSRQDASTGESISVKDRIGILDRKLRVVGENTSTEDEWLTWVVRAYQSVYAYETNGYRLLVARINMIETFVDYMKEKWGRVPSDKELRKIANIVAWNFWQMDGTSGTIPAVGNNDPLQYTIFDLLGEKPERETNSLVPCRVYVWRGGGAVEYSDYEGQLTYAM